MNKSNLTELNFELLISKIYHSMNLVKTKELSKYHIAPRQLYVLHVIHALGADANSSEVSKVVGRHVQVISRLADNLEKDGLIKRVKNTPKSKVLSFILTKKGLDMVKVSPNSKSIAKILATLPADERQQLDATLKQILKLVIELKQKI